MRPPEDPPDAPPEGVAIPVDGTLDLHTFLPREVKDLVAEYLSACRERGILEVRIVHGKGSGALRRTVHALLGRMAGVASYRTADADAGGWGATLVTLRPPEAVTPAPRGGGPEAGGPLPRR